MIYLDNAASTPLLPDVAAALARATEEHFSNPSAAHRLGAAAARALEAARAEVAALVRAEAGEIVFTSGGTEANALGIAGAAAGARGRHAIVSGLEHPAVLRNVERLAGGGGAHDWQVSVVQPTSAGSVTAASVVAALRPDTALVAVMLVNNELGTIQPVAEIAQALRASGSSAHLHVDAVQSAGLLPFAARALGADTVALSAHKLHGPKGAGALWLRPGARLSPAWDGGRQERGLRSGTEAVPALVAFGRAAAIARAETDAPAQVASLRDELERLVAVGLPASRPTVSGGPRAPHIASLTLPGLPAEPVLHALEARDVFASAGSACASRGKAPSHVLRAVGASENDAVIRLSLSRRTTLAEIRAAADALVAAAREIGSVVGLGRMGRR